MTASFLSLIAAGLRPLVWSTVGCVAVLATVPRSALADHAFPYASVVCSGNRALVRFTFAWNQDTPAFRGVAAQLPDKTARDLDGLEPANPSQCTLADGREITLRQGDKGDARAYGECWGDTTELFSLWVGRKPVYRREAWHNICGMPYDIKAIVIDGAHFEECRVTPRSTNEAASGPPICEDRSRRLAVADASPGHPGEMVLLHAANGMTPFCRSLVKEATPVDSGDSNTPWATWPTYQRLGIQEILSEQDRKRLQEAATNAPIDLDNGGKPVRALVADSEAGGGNADQSVWSFLPADATDSDVQALQAKLYGSDERVLKQLRSSGVAVLAGDQTPFGQVADVHLTPFRRNGVTWMFAVSRLAWPPIDVVLRPTPRGDMEKVCTFSAMPPL